MRMTIRIKNAGKATDLAAALERHFAQAGRSGAGLAELQPALKALSEQRKNLQEKKLQVDNIKACDAVHRYLTNVRKIMAAFDGELGDGRLELGFSWQVRNSFRSNWTSGGASKSILLAIASILQYQHTGMQANQP